MKKRGSVEKNRIMVISILILLILAFLIFQPKAKQEVPILNVEQVGEKYNIEIAVEKQDINNIIEVQQQEGDYVLKKTETTTQETSFKGGSGQTISPELVSSTIDIIGAEKPDFRFKIIDYDGEGITTQVLVVEELNIDKATITVAKKGPVSKIMYCSDFDVEDEKCNTWERTDILYSDNGDTITFDVTHFTGYGGAGLNANLTIWDDTNDPEGENIPHYTGNSIGFYAQYINATYDNVSNTTHAINGTNVHCNISFDLGSGWQDEAEMSFSSGLYEYSRSFGSAGTFNFKIECNDTSSIFDAQNTTDDFDVYSIASPPPPSKIPSASLTVSAASYEWIASSINVSRLGDYIRIEASGLIDQYADPECAKSIGPDGCLSGPGCGIADCNSNPYPPYCYPPVCFAETGQPRNGLVGTFDDPNRSNLTIQSCGDGIEFFAGSSYEISITSTSYLNKKLYFIVNDDLREDNCGAFYVNIWYNSPLASQENVTECFNITRPGSYEMKNDILNSHTSCCINIQANDVFFDGKGYTLQGDSAADGGICIVRAAQTFTNVTVKNIKVTNWDTYGIYMYYADKNTFENVDVISNSDYGIVATSANNNIFDNVNLSSNPDAGIMIDFWGSVTGSNNTLTDSYISNTTRGFYINGAGISNNNLIKDSVFESSSATISYGIALGSSSDDTNITNNNISFAYLGSYGIHGSASNQRTIIKNNHIFNPSSLVGHGIRNLGDYGNVSENNISCGYPIYNIGSNNRIINNTINGITGIYTILNSNLIENNSITVTQYGVRGVAGNNNVIHNNTIKGADNYPGIDISGSSLTGNEITNNTITSFSYGIQVGGSYHSFGQFNKNNITDVRIGIRFSGIDSKYNTIDTNFINASVVSTYNYGISGSGNFSFNNMTNNTIHSVKDGIYLTTLSSTKSPNNNNILNNSIYAATNGIYIKGYTYATNPAVDNPAKKNIIKNNYIRSSDKGIQLYDCAENTLMDNRIDQSGTWAIYLFGRKIYSNSFFDNNFTGNTKDFFIKNDYDSYVFNWNQSGDNNHLSNGKILLYNNSISNSIIDAAAENTGFFGCYDCNNVTLNNLAGYNNSHGVILAKSLNCKVNNVTFDTLIYPFSADLTYEKGVFLTYTNNSRITSVKGNSYNGVYLYYSYFNNISIENLNATYSGTPGPVGVYLSYSDNNIIQNGIVGCKDDTAAKSIYLKNSDYNLIKNTTAKIHSTSARNVYLENSNYNNITDSIINTSSAAANQYLIYLTGSNNNLIDKNKIYPSYSGVAGVYLKSSSQNTLIKNNLIYAPSAGSYGVFAPGSCNCHNTNITGNNITLTQAAINYGIYYGSSDDGYFINNNISADTCIYLYISQRSKILNSSLYGDLSSINLASSSPSTLIDNNYIKGTTTGGAKLNVVSGNDYVNITNNRIESSYLSQASDFGYISNNEFYNLIKSNIPFIDITPTAQNIVISNNSLHNISAASAYFMRIAGDYINVTNNTMYNQSLGDSAVSFASGANNCIFENNRISNVSSTPTNGILYINGADNNIFRNNIIDDSSDAKYAIYLVQASDNNEFTHNMIRNVNTSFRYSIAATSSTLRIKGLDTSQPDPVGYKNISKYINIAKTGTLNWLFLNISYLDSDYSSLAESTLRIWRYNTTAGAWQTNTGTNTYGVNTAQNNVYANITQFSDFGAFGEEGDIPTNLTISATDGCCDGTHLIRVNYTNTSGTHIPGATCNVTFDNNATDIVVLSDLGSYYFNDTKEYACQGATGPYPHTYNVTCYKDGYEQQKDNSTFIVAVGTFDIWECPGGTEDEIPTNLTIYNSSLLTGDCSDDVTFCANYTNTTGGEFIPAASCNITFDDIPGIYVMIENATIHNYCYARTTSFSLPAGGGIVAYTVNCSKTDYESQSKNSSLSFTSCTEAQVGAIPEFNILGIILILTLSIFGYIAVLKVHNKN